MISSELCDGVEYDDTRQRYVTLSDLDNQASFPIYDLRKTISKIFGRSNGDSNLAGVAPTTATVNATAIVPLYEIAVHEISKKIPEKSAVYLHQ